jgi:hypothetical protein
MYENRLQLFSPSDTFQPFLGLLNAIHAIECFASRYVFRPGLETAGRVRG